MPVVAKLRGMELPKPEHYIDGEWRAGPDAVDVLNPATEETLASIPSADDALVEEALAAAAAA
jgi:acyl-CoA reductase-like NAD-dependent aldehyde dehydrogenase